MYTRHQRGFTLIELLVVIAIIGILAAVVLGSLNEARRKGADASIRANLNNMRSQSEIYYDNNNLSYTDLCAQSELQSASSSIAAANGSFECNTSLVGSEFRLSSILSTGEYFCIDNDGFAEDVAVAPTGSSCQ
jgi:prepilin-type N-terminal cleavage/methylation domain-containing protein